MDERQNLIEIKSVSSSPKSSLLYRTKKKLYMLNDNFMHDDFVNRAQVDLEDDDNWDPHVEIYKNQLRKEKLFKELNSNIIDPNEIDEN